MRIRGGITTLCSLAAALSLFPISTASAGFCTEGVARDYAKPLKRLPAPHLPPADERLPFAPRGISFAAVGGPGLIVGSGEVGYRISFSPYEPGAVFSPPLNWHVSTRVARVTRSGDTLEVLRASEQNVSRLQLEGAQQTAELWLTSTVGEPGLYRSEITLSRAGGKRLGHYGGYYRVLEPTTAVSLALNGSTFTPGETVTATLLNKGTESLSFGLGYAIESWDGAAWGRAGISPSGPILAIGLSAGPGVSSSCWNFRIPAGAAPGLYRFSWSGDTYRPAPARKRRSLTRTAEFTILSP